MSANRAMLLATLAMQEDLKARKSARPLAFCDLWTPRCEHCGARLLEVAHPIWRCPTEGCEAAPAARHTSQRHILPDLGSDATAIFGGNRTGKTELGAMLAVLTATGNTQPWAVEWATRWGLPPHKLPSRAGRVLASALTSNDSKRYLRPKVKKYLPQGCVWRNEFGDGEAEVTLPGGGVIVFKSNDQKRKAYQGDWFDLVWLDEEHDHDIYEECEGRVSGVPSGHGHIVLTMTPLKGFSWVYDSFVKKILPEHRAHFLDALENPYTDLEKMKRWLNRLSPAKRAARKEGRFTALEGTIYDFDRALHVVPSFVPPKDWLRFRSIDFGTRNPFCCLWIAHDPTDDTMHVYREHYAADMQTKAHGEVINRLSQEEEIQWTVADPEDKQGRMTLVLDCNIETIPAYKAVREGIDAVAGRLLPDPEGRPHLLIHDCCVNLISELEQYKWADGGKEMPVKVNDHAADALRYFEMMHRRLNGSQ
jgi:phage terminase large subunit